MSLRNVFLYGDDYNLVLQNLIYLHSTNGKGYNVILITDKNINEYVEIPDYFYNMSPTRQAEFVKVNVVCDYGGIWLNSDTIVLDSLDSLFDFIENDNGFFIKKDKELMEVFGSKPNTDLMLKWKTDLNVKLEDTDGYIIFNGEDNLSPDCANEFLEKPYDTYKTIVREYQPLVIVSVCKKLQDKSSKEILDGNMPLNYFINKSFENMKLIDYDFIEIGTSNFDTLIQIADDNTKGISVDAVKYYIDSLPDKLNCKKINIGISNVKSTLDVYYISEKIIEENKLPHWFKGCNCINNYHPLHLKHNVSHLCEIEKVNVITPYELFYQNNVRSVNYLKIDTEGHDCIILKTLFLYIKNLPFIFHPKKILFETNENSSSSDVDEILELYYSLGYKLKSRGYDTIIIL